MRTCRHPSPVSWIGSALIAVALAGCAAGSPSSSPSPQSAGEGRGVTSGSTTSSASASSVGSESTTPSASAAPSGSASSLFVMSGQRLMLERLDGTDARAAAPKIEQASTGRLIYGDWSPDGTQLLFTEIPEPPATAPPRNSMWIVEVETGRTVRHIACASECHGLAFGAWSPDGKRIAYSVLGRDPRSGTPTGFSIAVIDLATGSRRTVLEADDRVQVAFPRWSPDGSRLVLQSARYREGASSPNDLVRSTVVVISSDGSKDQTPTEISKGLNAAKPDWGWRNNQIVFSTNDPDYPSSTSAVTALFTVAPDGTGLREVKSFPEPQVALTPSWSPRGPIVFTHCAIVGACYAAQIDADGSNLQTPQKADGAWPRERPTASR